MEITFRDLLQMMIKKIWVIIIAVLVAAIAAFVGSKFIIAPKYESNTAMLINYSTGSQSNAGSDLSYSKSIVDNCIQIIKADRFYVYLANYINDNMVGNGEGELASEVTPKQIKSSVKYSSQNSTSAIYFEIETTNSVLSYKIAIAMQETVADYIKSVYPVQSSGSIEMNFFETPIIANAPSSPNVAINTVIGVLIGGVLGVIIVVLIATFDTRIKNDDEIANAYKLPVLGTVPKFLDEDDKKKIKAKSGVRIDRIVDEKSPFNVIESFRNIRANLQFALPRDAQKAKVVAFNSSFAREGKTTVSVNTAVSVAHTNKKCLLIDADMRKPRIHKYFKLTNTVGLSTFLSNQCTYEECVQHTQYENLDLISSGEIPPNPAELLLESSLSKLLEIAKDKYDIIIIDTPPSENISDCITISPYIDGVIFVVKQYSSTHKALKDALSRFEFAKVHVLGVIINDYDDKFRVNKEYYKEYSEQSHNN